MDMGNSPVIGIEIYSNQLRAVTLRRHGKKIVPKEGFDRRGLIISGLDSPDVLVRQLFLKIKKETEINKVRDFQVEPLLPVPLEETCIYHKIIEKGEEGIQLALVIALKNRIEAHLKEMKVHGVDPERIRSVPEALAQFIAEFAPSDDPQGILHVGEKCITLCIVKEGIVLAANALDREEKDLKAAIAKSFLALTRKKGQRIFQLFATGETSSLPTLDIPVVPFNEDFLCKMAVPIGLALIAFKEKKGVDFRQKEFAYRHPFRRIRGALCCFGVALSLALASLCFFGHTLLKAKEQETEREYLHLLHITDRSEQEKLSVDQMRLKSLEIQKAEAGQTDLYQMVPRVPTASDVIAALGKEEGIYIQNFRYSLARRPDSTKKNDPYRVRVEFEFTSDTPTHARYFHDKLLAGYSLLDPNSEVRWVANKECYKVGFFLRNDP